MRKKITKKQMLLYKAVEEYFENNKQSPTLRELVKMVENDNWKPSTGSINGILKELHRKGFIEIERYKKRGIKLVGGGNYDGYIYFRKNDFEEKRYVKHGFSKGDKQNRRDVWLQRKDGKTKYN